MTTAAAPAPSMFAVFRKRDFSLLWLAQLVSTAGSALTDLAAGIFVYRETESALAVGLTLMATAVPSLVVGLLAGVYVDRHDRQRIMIVTCLVQAVIVTIIAFVIGIESIAIVGLYALILINAGVKQFFDPAHDSLIPELATDEELLTANSFLSIASFGSTAIGFAAAGLLASTVDLYWAFIIDAGTFLFSAACIALMSRHPMPTPDDDASVAVVVANLQVGLRDALRHADHPLAVRRRRADVLLVRAVERPAAADVDQGAGRDRIRVRAPGGPDLGRLRRRVVLHGALWPPPARARLDRRGDDRDGHQRHPVRPRDVRPDRDPARDDLRVLQLAVVGFADPRSCSGTPRARCAAACSRPSTSCATSSSCSAWPAPVSPTSSTSG